MSRYSKRFQKILDEHRDLLNKCIEENTKAYLRKLLGDSFDIEDLMKRMRSSK